MAVTIGALLILLVFSMAAGAAGEERTSAGGQWTYLLEDGSAAITGYLDEPAGALVIPSELDGYTMTAIGDSAFEINQGMTSVAIPNSVKRIGLAAFAYNENLACVTLPDGLEVIGESEFYFCFRLKEIVIPDSVASIGYGAFTGCTSLTDIIIPFSVISIGSGAFAWCSSLTSVTIPESVAEIGGDAFDAPNSEKYDDVSEEVYYGSNKLVLTVEKDSAAELFVLEKGIP